MASSEGTNKSNTVQAVSVCLSNAVVEHKGFGAERRKKTSSLLPESIWTLDAGQEKTNTVQTTKEHDLPEKKRKVKSDWTDQFHFIIPDHPIAKPRCVIVPEDHER
ncbi:hypothetical protein F2P81_024034 [Scophthalmus maximus]|uniref:Uncharacterized protein n=1 Tax=Scophthalmus maximus TaxID=52904 RepID=A0A6A4RY93_SCOMX|nr:hypothetical protein F2P81_024034 [Scophthalmus maximus]